MSAVQAVAVEYEKGSADTNAIYHRPERAFDHGLPDVPIRAFYDELDRVLQPDTPTGLVALDASEELHLPYPATTPIFLARYAVVRAGQALTHRFECNGEVHYVLSGRGVSRNGDDEIHWAAGDCLCFPGGNETVHEADGDSVLFTVTNEPELAFAHTVPNEDSPVVAAVFRGDQIDRELSAVQHLAGAPKTAGKSVSFTTPAMDRQLSGALFPSMMVAVNSLEPGGVQRRHRHNSVAITVAISCEGTYSAVGDQRLPWRKFGVFVTPPRIPHSHVNEGGELMRALVVQDGPIFYNCRSVGFEWTDEVW